MAISHVETPAADQTITKEGTETVMEDASIEHNNAMENVPLVILSVQICVLLPTVGTPITTDNAATNVSANGDNAKELVLKGTHHVETIVVLQITMQTTILNVVEVACTIVTGLSITIGLVETHACTETILISTMRALTSVLRQVNLATESVLEENICASRTKLMEQSVSRQTNLVRGCVRKVLFCVRTIVMKKGKFRANVLL